MWPVLFTASGLDLGFWTLGVLHLQPLGAWILDLGFWICAHGPSFFLKIILGFVFAPRSCSWSLLPR